MPTNINCIAYKNGVCTHPLVPKSWFSTTYCIEEFPPRFKDPRIKPGCDIKHPNVRPSPPPVRP